MNELKTLTKSDVIDLTLEELEDLKTNEKVYLESGEALLEALLNIPFKSKDKVESIMSKISQHRHNIRVINSRIDEIEISKSGPVWCSTGQIFIGNGANLTYSNVSSPIWTTTTGSHFKYETTDIEYIDSSNNKQKITIVDDVFQSVLGNYYLTNGSSNVPLNRVVQIDSESNVGKWYDRMCKNFDRENKLNRIVKDEDNDEKES